MKYLKDITEGFFNTSGSGLEASKASIRKRLQEIIDSYNPEDFIINDDLTVSTSENLERGYLTIHINTNVKEFGVKFKFIGCCLDCCQCDKLVSLKGLPDKIFGDFDCSNCGSLKTLDGCPKEIGGWFDCSQCDNITSLEGGPKIVGSEYNNGSNYTCSWCKNLVTLKGAPKKLNGYFNCSYCSNLKSLKYAPKCRGIIENI